MPSRCPFDSSFERALLVTKLRQLREEDESKAGYLIYSMRYFERLS
jgi:hypothetical protein